MNNALLSERWSVFIVSKINNLKFKQFADLLGWGVHPCASFARIFRGLGTQVRVVASGHLSSNVFNGIRLPTH